MLSPHHGARHIIKLNEGWLLLLLLIFSIIKVDISKS